MLSKLGRRWREYIMWSRGGVLFSSSDEQRMNRCPTEGGGGTSTTMQKNGSELKFVEADEGGKKGASADV